MKDSVSLSMLSCSLGTRQPSGFLAFDGQGLQPLPQTGIPHVVDIKYDPVAGVLQVYKSDGQVKTFQGFITKLDLNRLAPNKRVLNKGSQGPQGKPGLDGRNGRDGRQGCDGPPGDRGRQGVRGDRGTPGIHGPQGSQGKTGPRGEKGFRGWDGLQGQPGLPGLQGDTGSRGLRGDRGDTGVTGPQGFRGRQGCPGIRGVTGQTGARGDDGCKGDQGPPGQPGRQGRDAVVIDGKDGKPSPIRDLVSGPGISVSWVKDKNGNLVSKSIDFEDCGCLSGCPPT